MSIGSNIRAQREHRQLTQQELATKSHISQGQLSAYENDSVVPGISKLSRLADALGVSVAVLDESLLNVPGFNGNSISGSHIEGNVAQTIHPECTADVESFRAGLIAGLIMLDIAPEPKDAVLKFVASYQLKNK